MKKKTILKVLVLCLLMSMAGCKEENKPEATPSSTVIELPLTLEPTLAVTDIFEEEVLEIDNLKIDISSQEELQGKQMFFEKKDASELAKYNAANRCRSRDLEINQQSLFCVDADTGVVYFVNQNKDWYIYQLQNGVAELAVALPARELYMWDGTLYFVIEDYDTYELIGICENDIYAYTPADGSIRFVYAAKEFENASESHIKADENGLYLFCSKQGREIVSSTGSVGHVIEKFYYMLPYGCSEIEEDQTYGAVSGWGDYYFHSTLSCLKWRGGGNEADIPLEAPASKCCIIGDNYYSVSSADMAFYITDILTGEIKSYECKPVLKKAIGSGIEGKNVSWVQSFTVTEEYVWMIVKGTYLVRIEPESSEIQYFVLENLSGYMEKLYTDGTNIYALYRKDILSDEADLIWIKTEEMLGISPIYGVEKLAIDYLTE